MLIIGRYIHNLINHKDLSKREGLKKHVYRLSHEIGERNIYNYAKLDEAAEYITEEFRSFGYKVDFQAYDVLNKSCRNIIAVKEGAKKPGEIIILGAHYDSRNGPGADDNASAVAGLLETAKILSGKLTGRTIKFIAFTNEEPPLFKKKSMGSRVYTKASRKNKDDIKGALILEMIGYFSEKPRSQRHPFGVNFFYPSTGNFIGVIGNAESKYLLKYTVSSFRRTMDLQVKWMVAPNIVIGIGMSDDWSFWKEKYPAVMITDTAYFRNPNYHKKSDTYDTLDYKKISEVVKGVVASLEALTK